MKRIKQIRETYDFITEKEDTEMRKLTSLVRAGLFDSTKLPLLKRAMEKDVSRMTPAEKKVLMELLDSLMSEVLHSSSLYNKIKQDVRSNKDLNEAKKDYLSKVDPRFDMNYPSEKDMPQIIILKRKAIRVYPDSQKVGLYYSQALDKYVSIPFGPGIPVMNEESEINEISKDLKSKVYTKRKDQGDDENDVRKQMKAADTLKRFQKKHGKYAAAELEKSVNSAKETKDKEKEAIGKMKRLEVNPVVSLGVLAGLGARKLYDKIAAKRAEKVVKAPETKKQEPASTKTPEKTEKMSTSGTTVAKFGKEPISSKPKVTIEPKSTVSSSPKSDQPDDSGLAAVSKIKSDKTKTLSYQSQSAQTIPNIKHGAPKKAGGAFLPPSHPSRSTSAQPVPKPKALKAAIMQKMNEKRNEKTQQVDEAVPLIPIALGAARIAAPVIARGAGALATGAKTLGRGARALGRGAKKVAGKAAAAGAGYVAGTTSNTSSDSTSSSTDKGADEPKILKPGEFSMKIKTNAPSSKSSMSAYDRRKEILNRQAFSENVIEQLKNLEEEKTLNIHDNSIKINKVIAEKIIHTYNSLSKDNKKKMENMLNESAESFRKVIDFAIRQA